MSHTYALNVSVREISLRILNSMHLFRVSVRLRKEDLLLRSTAGDYTNQLINLYNHNYFGLLQME